MCFKNYHKISFLFDLIHTGRNRVTITIMRAIYSCYEKFNDFTPT